MLIDHHPHLIVIQVIVFEEDDLILINTEVDNMKEMTIRMSD